MPLRQSLDPYSIPGFSIFPLLNSTGKNPIVYTLEVCVCEDASAACGIGGCVCMGSSEVA